MTHSSHVLPTSIRYFAEHIQIEAAFAGDDMDAIFRRKNILGLLIFSLLGSGCGGGGGGNSTPPVQKFSIGGAVSGLAANTSVVLKNNGADLTTINANGGFTFATQIASGSTYNVTVETQPTNEHCTVDNGSGMVSGAVTNVAVICTSTQTTLNRVVADPNNVLVGTWYTGANSSDGGFMFTFLANGYYFMTDDSTPNDPAVSKGIEYGTYTCVLSGGSCTLTATVIDDTNGEAGLSNPAPGSTTTLQISGDILLAHNSVDGDVVFNRVVTDAGNALVGSWYSGAGSSDGGFMFTFLANGHYFMADDTDDSPADSTTSKGMEYGTYTCVLSSGSCILTATVIDDTNGEAGLSNPTPGSTTTLQVSGDTLTATENN